MTAAPNQTEIDRLAEVFRGSGRFALMGLGQNLGRHGTFRDNLTLDRLCRRAGNPGYVMLKELGQSGSDRWLGYEIAWTGVVSHLSQALYRPMRRLRIDAPQVRSDGATATLPFTRLGETIDFDIGAVEPRATRIGVIVGYAEASHSVVIVTVTAAGTGEAVSPNQLPKASQLVASGGLAPEALASRGGPIPDEAHVLGTGVRDVLAAGQRSGCHQLIALDLPAIPGGYRLHLRPTTAVGAGGKGPALRTCITYATFASDDLQHGDPDADLYRCEAFSAANDASANETFVLSGRAAGSAASRRLMGQGHGGEVQQGEESCTVDGKVVRLRNGSRARARKAGLATLELGRDHGRSPGETVSVTGLGGADYNIEGAVLSNVTATSIAWPSPGPDEAQTADSGGVVWSHQLQVGQQIAIGWASLISHQEDGPLGRITDARYRLDAAGFTTGGVFEATRDLDLDSATYLQLATVWSGDRRRLGPRYPGEKIWRILGSQETHQPAHDNDAPFWRGLQPAGVIAWDPIGGRASALMVSAPWLHTTAWNGGRAELFVQDRKGGTVEKLYLRWSRLPENRLAAGDHLTFAGRRLDTVATPAARDPLEPVS